MSLLGALQVLLKATSALSGRMIMTPLVQALLEHRCLHGRVFGRSPPTKTTPLAAPLFVRLAQRARSLHADRSRLREDPTLKTNVAIADALLTALLTVVEQASLILNDNSCGNNKELCESIVKHASSTLLQIPYLSRSPALARLSPATGAMIFSALKQAQGSTITFWGTPTARFTIGNLISIAARASEDAAGLPDEAKLWNVSWLGDFLWKPPTPTLLHELVSSPDHELQTQLNAILGENVVARIAAPHLGSHRPPSPSRAGDASAGQKQVGFFAEMRARAKEKKATSALVAARSVNLSDSTSRQHAARSIAAMSTSMPPPWLKFAAIVITAVDAGRLQILNAFARHASDILPSMYTFCLTLLPVFDLLLDTPSPALEGLVITSEMQKCAIVSFSLFATVVSHVMLVTGDDDVHVLGVPLPQAELRQLATLVNDLTLRCILRLHAKQQDPQQQAASVLPTAAAQEEWRSMLLRDDFAMRQHFRILLRQLQDLYARSPQLLGDMIKPAPSSSDKKKSQNSAGLWEAGQSSSPAFYAGWSPVARHVLAEMPHAVPFHLRAAFVGDCVAADRKQREVDKLKLGLRIRRSHILPDLFEQLSLATKRFENTSFLRATWHITFIGQGDRVEAGIDAGGVFKELIDLAVKQAFSIGYGLFCAPPAALEGDDDDDQQKEGQRFESSLYPNPSAKLLLGGDDLELAAQYHFLGILIGKCIHEGVLVNVPFAGFFLNNVLGRGNSFDNLRQLDPQQYRSLKLLKDMEDCSEACLYFCVDEMCLGETRTADLIPDGRQVLVTNENVIRYLHLLAHYRLVASTKDATNAFASGLFAVVDKAWLSIFSPGELQQLISGGKGLRLDVNDLREHVKLVGGFTATSRTVELLWEILEEMSQDDQEKFLQFCTGSSRPPLLGFRSLNPPFSLRNTDEGGGGSALNYLVDIDRLPSASTCFNLLKLPPYKSKSNFKEKLLQAIRSGTGFELS